MGGAEETIKGGGGVTTDDGCPIRWAGIRAGTDIWEAHKWALSRAEPTPIRKHSAERN